MFLLTLLIFGATNCVKLDIKEWKPVSSGTSEVRILKGEKSEEKEAQDRTWNINKHQNQKNLCQVCGSYQGTYNIPSLIQPVPRPIQYPYYVNQPYQPLKPRPVYGTTNTVYHYHHSQEPPSVYGAKGKPVVIYPFKKPEFIYSTIIYPPKPQIPCQAWPISSVVHHGHKQLSPRPTYPVINHEQNYGQTFINPAPVSKQPIYYTLPTTPYYSRITTPKPYQPPAIKPPVYFPNPNYDTTTKGYDPLYYPIIDQPPREPNPSVIGGGVYNGKREETYPFPDVNYEAPRPNPAYYTTQSPFYPQWLSTTIRPVYNSDFPTYYSQAPFDPCGHSPWNIMKGPEDHLESGSHLQSLCRDIPGTQVYNGNGQSLNTLKHFRQSTSNGGISNIDNPLDVKTIEEQGITFKYGIATTWKPDTVDYVRGIGAVEATDLGGHNKTTSSFGSGVIITVPENNRLQPNRNPDFDVTQKPLFFRSVNKTKANNFRIKKL
ncbi:adhesive plaque matrix protein-like [Artemia franciscana]|uniref:adhesive plaque matrix protein-like n=1 Tax=Artemia franciscana TaxID=6661 RepID=UPI0032DA27F5